MSLFKGRNEESPFRALTHFFGCAVIIFLHSRNEESPFRALTHKRVLSRVYLRKTVEMKKARLGR